jgi:hypothetical protein
MIRRAWPECVITTAVPVWPCAAYYNFKDFYNTPGNINQINIMAYRQADGSSVTGFNSPIYQPKGTYSNYNGGCWLGPNGGANPYGQGPVDAWIKKGILAGKIGMIMPMEMAKVDGNDAPGQTRVGYSQYANYSAVVTAIKNGAIEHYDDSAKSMWCGYTDGSGKHVFFYENGQTYLEKFKVIKKLGLGGGALWEDFRGYATNTSPADTLERSVLAAMKQVIGGVAPPPIIIPVTISILGTPQYIDTAGVNYANIGYIMPFTSNVNQTCDSIVYYRGPKGGTLLRVTSSVSGSITWQPQVIGNWATQAIAYKGSQTVTSNSITVTVVAVIPPPPPPVVCDTLTPYLHGVAVGKASVTCPICPPPIVCPPQIDTSSFAPRIVAAIEYGKTLVHVPDSALIYKNAWNAVLDSIPEYVSTRKPARK